MFYVVTKQRICKAPSLSVLNKRLGAKFDMDEFVQIGADYIVNVDNIDLDFVQDKRKVSTIMFGNFFKKDNTVKIISIINLILLFIILVKVMG